MNLKNDFNSNVDDTTVLTINTLPLAPLAPSIGSIFSKSLRSLEVWLKLSMTKLNG